MQIRRMTEADCPEVAKIEQESFSMPWSLKDFLDTVNKERFCYIVALDEDKIVGYCGFIHAADEGEIPNVCVTKEERKKGIGEAMLWKLFELAKDYKLNSLFLEVRSSNEPAKKLYQKLGFQAIGVRKGFYELPKEDAILMQKCL